MAHQADDIHRLITKHERRRQKLKEQLALYGPDVKIEIQIEDIEAELAELEAAKAGAQRLTTLPLDTIPNPATLPPGSRMPLNPNPLFVGREKDLKGLAQALKVGQATAIGQIAAATGLGGIGKTQLAAEFVHRYGQYFSGGVFWLSFADPKAIPAEIAACGGPAYMNLANFEQLELPGQVELVQAAWSNPLPRLLVFDNCEEESLLAHWRPATGGCRVLVTSRRATWDPTLDVQALPLGVLSRPESIELLRKHRPDLAGDEAEAIAKELGDLPLALHLSGSFLARYKRVMTGAAYLAQLRDERLLNHPALRGRGTTLSPTDHVLHVARTFALSYNKFDAADPTDGLAQALLTRAAYFAPGEPIPCDLLLATLEVEEADPDAALQAEDALVRLIELGLLEAEAEETVTLHRLLAVFAREVAVEAEAQAAVEKAILQELSNRLDQAGYLEPLLGLQPHLRAVTDAAKAREDEPAADLCIWLGYYLKQIGDYAGARPYYERALAIREAGLGPQHPDTASSLNNLGYLLQAMGDLAGARPYLERALAIREAGLGSQHPDTANSLNNLGYLLQAMGDLAGARPYYERALAICEAGLGPQHPATANSLNNLGSLLYRMGDLAGARPYLERALAIFEAGLGPQHPATALSLNNLGYLLQAMGDLAGARPYYERALAIFEAGLGPQHPATAQSLNNLAILCFYEDKFEEAATLMRRALAIREAVLGPDHPDTQGSRQSLAAIEEELSN